MKKISSGAITFHKKVFPIIWFGFLGVFVVVGLMGPARDGEWVLLLMPCIMAAFGYFIFKKLLWELVDEVYDCGDSLLVRNRGEEETIALRDIMNVSVSSYVNPPRITLRVAVPSRFGTEISFSPPVKFSLNPFAKNPVGEDLIVRVDQARRGRGG